MSAVAAESSDSASSMAPLGLELPAYAAPQKLGRDVVGGGELLANPGELGRLVVTTLPVEDVGEQASGGRDVVALAHLLKTPVVRPQLELGGGQIPGEQLDDRRVQRRESREEKIAELLSEARLRR